MSTLQDCACRKCRQDFINVMAEVLDDVEQGYKEDIKDAENERQRMKAVFKLMAAMNVRRALAMRFMSES